MWSTLAFKKQSPEDKLLRYSAMHKRYSTISVSPAQPLCHFPSFTVPSDLQPIPVNEILLYILITVYWNCVSKILLPKWSLLHLERIIVYIQTLSIASGWKWYSRILCIFSDPLIIFSLLRDIICITLHTEVEALKQRWYGRALFSNYMWSLCTNYKTKIFKTFCFHLLWYCYNILILL